MGRRLDIRLRIDLAGKGSIGPGKIALLEAIQRHGSLSRAARALGMSYRRAWGLLMDLNASMPEPVAKAVTGGAGGGGVQLTRFGRELASAYREIETAARVRASRRFAAILTAKAPARRGPGLRRAVTLSPRRRVS